MLILYIYTYPNHTNSITYLLDSGFIPLPPAHELLILSGHVPLQLPLDAARLGPREAVRTPPRSTAEAFLDHICL